MNFAKCLRAPFFFKERSAVASCKNAPRLFPRIYIIINSINIDVAIMMGNFSKGILIMRVFYRGKFDCRPEVFCRKGVLRNFGRFIGKHLCQSFFFNKFIKNETQVQVFCLYNWEQNFLR